MFVSFISLLIVSLVATSFVTSLLSVSGSAVCLLPQAAKTVSKQEQSQTCLSFAEREQAQPKVNAIKAAKANNTFFIFSPIYLLRLNLSLSRLFQILIIAYQDLLDLSDVHGVIVTLRITPVDSFLIDDAVWLDFCCIHLLADKSIHHQ